MYINECYINECWINGLREVKKSIKIIEIIRSKLIIKISYTTFKNNYSPKYIDFIWMVK